MVSADHVQVQLGHHIADRCNVDLRYREALQDEAGDGVSAVIERNALFPPQLMQVGVIAGRHQNEPRYQGRSVQQHQFAAKPAEDCAVRLQPRVDERCDHSAGLMVNLPNDTPRSTPEPLPAKLIDTSPLVMAEALADLAAPAWASVCA